MLVGEILKEHRRSVDTEQRILLEKVLLGRSAGGIEGCLCIVTPDFGGSKPSRREKEI